MACEFVMTCTLQEPLVHRKLCGLASANATEAEAVKDETACLDSAAIGTFAKSAVDEAMHRSPYPVVGSLVDAVSNKVELVEDIQTAVTVRPDDIYRVHSILSDYAARLSQPSGDGEQSDSSDKLCLRDSDASILRQLLDGLGSAPKATEQCKSFLLEPRHSDVESSVSKARVAAVRAVDPAAYDQLDTDGKRMEVDELKRRLRIVLLQLDFSIDDLPVSSNPLEQLIEHSKMIFMERGRAEDRHWVAVLFELGATLNATLPIADPSSYSCEGRRLLLLEMVAEANFEIERFDKNQDRRDGAYVLQKVQRELSSYESELATLKAVETKMGLWRQLTQLGPRIAQISAAAARHAQKLHPAINDKGPEEQYCCVDCCLHMKDRANLLRVLKGEILLLLSTTESLQRDHSAHENTIKLSRSELVEMTLEDYLCERMHSLQPMINGCNTSKSTCSSCRLDQTFAAHLQKLQFITPDYSAFSKHLLEDGDATEDHGAHQVKYLPHAMHSHCC
eukprot:SAG31_NODE_2363_length_5862_cov_2.146452_3_plen_507_part_00